jgi:hypothetical protein
VAPDVSLRLAFDQPVTKGTGVVRVYRPDGTERFPAIGVDGGTVVLSETGQEVVIPLPAALLPGETVYVNVDAGTFVNTAAEPFPGITGTDAWRFTANAAPALIGTIPAFGATDVGLTDPLIATFSENVQKGTGRLHVYYNGTNHPVDVTEPSVTVQGNQLTLAPAAPLPAGTQVSISLDPGVVQDAAGLPSGGIAGPADWRFTTNQAPAATAFLPLNGSSNVPVGSALQLTFSEPVRKGTGNITLFEGATAVMTIGVNSGAVSISGNTVIITPLVGLPSGTVLSVQMPAGAFTDLVNIPFAGIADAVTWAFSVADATVPVVTSLSPADGASGWIRTSCLRFRSPSAKEVATSPSPTEARARAFRWAAHRYSCRAASATRSPSTRPTSRRVPLWGLPSRPPPSPTTAEMPLPAPPGAAASRPGAFPPMPRRS